MKIFVAHSCCLAMGGRCGSNSSDAGMGSELDFDDGHPHRGQCSTVIEMLDSIRDGGEGEDRESRRWPSRKHLQNHEWKCRALSYNNTGDHHDALLLNHAQYSIKLLQRRALCCDTPSDIVRHIVAQASWNAYGKDLERGIMNFYLSRLPNKEAMRRKCGAGWQVNADMSLQDQRSVAWLLKKYSFEVYPAESTVQHISFI